MASRMDCWLAFMKRAFLVAVPQACRWRQGLYEYLSMPSCDGTAGSAPVMQEHCVKEVAKQDEKKLSHDDREQCCSMGQHDIHGAYMPEARSTHGPNHNEKRPCSEPSGPRRPGTAAQHQIGHLLASLMLGCLGLQPLRPASIRCAVQNCCLVDGH